VITGFNRQVSVFKRLAQQPLLTEASTSPSGRHTLSLVGNWLSISTRATSHRTDGTADGMLQKRHCVRRTTSRRRSSEDHGHSVPDLQPKWPRLQSQSLSGHSDPHAEGRVRCPGRTDTKSIPMRGLVSQQLPTRGWLDHLGRPDRLDERFRGFPSTEVHTRACSGPT